MYEEAARVNCHSAVLISLERTTRNPEEGDGSLERKSEILILWKWENLSSSLTKRPWTQSFLNIRKVSRELSLIADADWQTDRQTNTLIP